MKFLYIIVTSTEKDDDFVLKNTIGEAIVKRINRAHEEREPFKVYVVIPLMPGFPAELSTKEASNPRYDKKKRLFTTMYTNDFFLVHSI